MTEVKTPNERLRASMRRQAVTPQDLARLTGADIKTVYRWTNAGRLPLGRHQVLIAKRLGETVDWLWPEAVRPTVGKSVAEEIVAAYAYRSDAPTSTWWELFTRAEGHVDLLGYSLYFLTLQHPGFVESLLAKCAEGIRVRIVVADPASEHVAYRDREEGTPLTLPVRIHTTLEAIKPLLARENFELRYQDVPLYNSVFRFDDDMLMTPHLYATNGSQAPMLHLRRLGPGGLFERFLEHFEGVWGASQPHFAPAREPGADDGGERGGA